MRGEQEDHGDKDRITIIWRCPNAQLSYGNRRERREKLDDREYFIMQLKLNVFFKIRYLT